MGAVTIILRGEVRGVVAVILRGEMRGVVTVMFRGEMRGGSMSLCWHHSCLLKFNMAVVRSYVEGSGHLMWCCNPQGCGQVLCKGDGINSGTCQKCQWSSCFSCSHTEVMC